MPIESTKIRQSFIGQNPTNSWEQFRPGRVMMPTYRVNLYGQKNHQTLSKRYAEDEIDDEEHEKRDLMAEMHGLSSAIAKHMYYAKWNGFGGV